MKLQGLPARHTRPCLPLQAPHRAQCPSLASHSARGARCVAQSEREQQRVEKGARQALPQQCADGSFPQLENDKEDVGWLPKRQPGSFPSTGVRRRFGGLTSAWERFSIDYLEGADVKYARKAAGGEKEYDPLRDGPLRYLGYANECGEAFAAWLPLGGVPLSYAVAIGYVLVDTADKGVKAFQMAQQELGANAALHPEVDTPRLEKLLAIERAMDTVVWQLLASVACPGYTIHTLVALVHAALLPVEALDTVHAALDSAAAALSISGPALLEVVDKSLPTAAGLAAIPFIVHPIDNAVHLLLNVTMRPAVRKFICGAGQGALADLEICEACQLPQEP